MYLMQCLINDDYMRSQYTCISLYNLKKNNILIRTIYWYTHTSVDDERGEYLALQIVREPI